jgi:hypothetical protein
MEHIEKLSKDELIKLLKVYAKNWLAHDGCWFLAAEDKYGIEAAIELDTKSWNRFAVAEARRIMKEFNIFENGGLKALEQAFGYRLYAAINKQEIEWVNDQTMVFRMVECRVQKTRAEKNLSPFPCKPVGMVEFSQFAKTIDPRIQTRCRTCPPDSITDVYCEWEFTVQNTME